MSTQQAGTAGKDWTTFKPRDFDAAAPDTQLSLFPVPVAGMDDLFDGEA